MTCSSIDKCWLSSRSKHHVAVIWVPVPSVRAIANAWEIGTMSSIERWTLKWAHGEAIAQSLGGMLAPV
jgi:hypothetical protein